MRTERQEIFYIKSVLLLAFFIFTALPILINTIEHTVSHHKECLYNLQSEKFDHFVKFLTD